MIKKDNVQDIFNELDSQLAKKKRQAELVIFGSASLMIQGISNADRFTEDVDVVKPPFDNEMWVISAETGEKFGMKMGWLNTAGLIFARNFPEGWEERTLEVYKGSALSVRSLGRKDIIFTKFHALCSRAKATDREDMEALDPSKVEISAARDWVVELKPEMKDLADDFVKVILNKGRGLGR